jgi:hypothetical protein
VISTHCGRHMQCAVCSWQASVRVGESCVAGTCPFRFNSQIETRDKQSSASENGKTGLVCSPCSRAGRSATSRYPELGRMDSMWLNVPRGGRPTNMVPTCQLKTSRRGTSAFPALSSLGPGPFPHEAKRLKKPPAAGWRVVRDRDGL